MHANDTAVTGEQRENKVSLDRKERGIKSDSIEITFKSMISKMGGKDMNISTIVATTAFLLVSTLAVGNENIIRMIHGVQLDMCKHTQGCKPSDISHCENEMKGAFTVCDRFLKEDKPRVNMFSDCVTSEMTRRIGQAKVMNFMLAELCPVPEIAKTIPQPGMPRAAEQPQYFIAIGLDYKTLALSASPQEACARGAAKQKEVVEKDNSSVSIDINLGPTQKTRSITGTGEDAYKYLFGKTTFLYGKCTGKHISTFIKNDHVTGFKKGEKLVANYEPDIYVVVDCKSNPKPAVCD